MSDLRVRKVAELLREELSARLASVLPGIPLARGALVTLTAVRLSPDLKQARILISIFPEGADREAIMDGLRQARGRMKRDLAHVLRLRQTPELRFELDTSAEEGARIDKLIQQSLGVKGPDDDAGDSGDSGDDEVEDAGRDG